MRARSIDQDEDDCIQGLSIQTCSWCPRKCGIDRSLGVGFCGCPDTIKLARAALHYGEEPCLSGSRGSGTIFFSGCNLRCCFCQNYQISSGGWGQAVSIPDLAKICLELQANGAHNLNLVTTTPYLPWVLPALDSIRDELRVPVVYNCSGYEKLEVVRTLQPYVDIFLPDLKYMSDELAWKYSRCPDYFKAASLAVQAMVEQTGELRFDSEGILQKGTIIRHLVLPGARHDSIALLGWLARNLPQEDYILSLMSQYTPVHQAHQHAEINRRLTSYEYESVVSEALRLGLGPLYIQGRASASLEYIPPFNLEGIPSSAVNIEVRDKR